MCNKDQILEAIVSLTNELDHIVSLIEDDGLLDSHREELESQSGTIDTILQQWCQE